MSKIYLIADTHFGHANIIRYCNRPFENTYYMKTTIVERWNAIVNDDDIVWHLGDFGFKDGIDINIFNSLKGQKHFIVGNHDGGKVKSWPWKSVVQQWTMIYQDKEILMKHSPDLEWPGKKRGVILIHGHTHGNTIRDGTRIYGQVDVGVDVWNFTPVHIDQAIEFALRRV